MSSYPVQPPPPFAEVPLYTTRLNVFTIQQLQEFIRMVNGQMGLNIRTTQGKKAEIVGRLTNQLEFWKNRADTASFQTFTRLYHHQKAEIAGTKSRYREGYQAAAPASAPYRPPVASTSAAAGGSRYGAATSAMNSWDSRTANISSVHPPAPRPFKWRDSPMVKVVQNIGAMNTLPASNSNTDRKAASASFYLPDDVRRKIEYSLANPKEEQFALRVYCTPQTYYNSTSGAVGSAVSEGLPVEFPPTSEIRVNGYQIAASLKGVKKKVGSCPPANLHKAKNAADPMIRLEPGHRNSVELIHINQSQNGAKPLNYYFQVCLARSVTPEDLVKQVNGARHRTAADVVAELTKKDDEDEIEHGALTIGLKCPLSYIRMSHPMRSTKCNHVQCFDAASWFQINEQTPTWTCPVCEQYLKVENLFIDDFTGNIIKSVPSSVDEVVVEPNAQWHTTDKKYGDPAWLEAHAKSAPASAVASLRSSPAADVKGKGRADEVEVFVLDSDDEDGEVYAAVQPLTTIDRSPYVDDTPPPFGTSDEPIDLTVDSDDEVAPAPPPELRRASATSLAIPPNGASGVKRSATEEVVSELDKRPRYDSGMPSNGASSYSSHSPAGSFQQVPPPPPLNGDHMPGYLAVGQPVRPTSAAGAPCDYGHDYRSPSLASTLYDAAPPPSLPAMGRYNDPYCAQAPRPASSGQSPSVNNPYDSGELRPPAYNDASAYTGGSAHH